MRTLCDVLDAMRKCYETRNFSGINGLIEEAQDMGNRMEAGLDEKRGYCHYRDERKRLKDEAKELLKAVNKLRKKEGKEPRTLKYYY